MATNGSADAATALNEAVLEAETAALRAKIEETRTELTHTIDAIEDRLSPGRIKDRAQARVRDATIGRLGGIGGRLTRRGKASVSAMPRLTFAGHPLHPQLVALPAGLLPFALAMDVLRVSTGKRSYSQAARFALIGALASGALAGSAGAGDYLAISAGHRAKRTATIHGALNLSLLGLTALNLALRLAGRRPGALLLTLSAAGTLGLAVSSWFGQHMVYDLGLRVRGAAGLPGSGDGATAGPPGDRQVHRAPERVAVHAPAAGPARRPA